jgi:predicted DNA binding protein
MNVEETHELLQLSLELWHPNCWTIQVTDQSDAGLLGHGAYTTTDGTAKGRFTVYGDTIDVVESLITRIDDSKLTHSVQEIQQISGSQSDSVRTPGNVMKEIFVEYDSHNSIDDAFVSRGFVYDGPTNIKKGKENWSLVAHYNRSTIQDLLDEIRKEHEAKIKITGISPAGQTNSKSVSLRAQLTERQWEIFEFARQNGYYKWPRDATARELATELDLSKTTFLEHLRKAEAKLLNDIERVSR